LTAIKTIGLPWNFLATARISGHLSPQPGQVSSKKYKSAAFPFSVFSVMGEVFSQLAGLRGNRGSAFCASAVPANRTSPNQYTKRAVAGIFIGVPRIQDFGFGIQKIV
jgi:hypothetical protein